MRPSHCTWPGCESMPAPYGGACYCHGPQPDEIEEARIRLDERKKVLAEVFAILDERMQFHPNPEVAEPLLDYLNRQILTLLPEET
jgi:hypothetical protein